MPPDKQQPTNPKPSFREKLLGSTQEIPSRPKEDMIKNKLVRIEHENGNRLLPKVYLEPQVFQELCTPWKDALVVKLLGKNLGYNTMKDRLHKVWKLQGGFEIMDNDNGFYMVKFDQSPDKEKVISGGPWLIYDHCLAVSHWSPEFASPNAKVERTVVWVRFPGLNLVYYDESFLLAMASAIGRPIKVDTNTLKVERGKFARVCVEVDLTMPVIGKIWVNGHWYKVQYEGLHLICTNCGCYGHLGRNCNIKNTTDIPAAASNHQHDDNIQRNNHNTGTAQPHSIPTSQNGQEFNASTTNQSTEKEAIISNDEGVKDIHGDWMLVTRRKRSNIPSHSLTPKNVTLKNYRLPTNSSPLVHQPKLLASTNKLPPRPNINDSNRANKTSFDPKRRRHDISIIEPTFKLPIDPSTSDPKTTPTQKSKPGTYKTPPSPQGHVTKDPPSKHDLSNPITEASTRFVPPFIEPIHALTNHNTTEINLDIDESNNNTVNNNCTLPQDETVDTVIPNCNENQETEFHSEEDMVT